MFRGALRSGVKVAKLLNVTPQNPIVSKRGLGKRNDTAKGFAKWNGMKAAKLLNEISQSPSHSRKKRSASVFWHEKTSPLEKDEPTLKRWVLAAGFIAFVSTETNP